MQSAMLVITLVALALCGVLATITARLLREDRRRSAARVAMLEAAALSTSDREAVSSSAAVTPMMPVDAVPIRPRTEISQAPPNLGIAPADLFGTAASGGPGLRLAGVVALGAVVLAAAIGVVVLGGESGQDSARVAASSSADEPLSGQPLQLVALSHARTGGGLTISGVIRNPEGGTARANLAAVVFLFDRQGSFLTSTRANVDPATLAPGQESPFAVNVPQASAVGRYRVSFRTDLGVVPHVDRRAGLTPQRAGN